VEILCKTGNARRSETLATAAATSAALTVPVALAIAVD
jgi:hypothetical protein